MIKRLLVLGALALTYVISGKFGLRLALVNPSATAVWPPTGIALASFLVFGYGVWPAILVGAFLVNLTTAGNVLTSLSIGVGNTLEGVVGALLVNRFANGRRAVEDAGNVLRFAGLGALAAPAISATVGVTTLAVGGFASWASYGSVWLTWWLGDAAGALIVAPPLLEWSNHPVPRRRGAVRSVEAVGLLTALALMAMAVFGGLLPDRLKNAPLEFLCTPFLLWAAFRFGRRATATAILLVSVIATWGTVRGLGPFNGGGNNDSLLLVQAFMGVTALTMLMLAGEVAERRNVERRLRHLAVSDPLTGLANYRQLVSVVETEITRAQRTERSFAILFLDLDDLKGVNDRYGHLVGSRALLRVAAALKLTSRAMDTAARFGGDEFALLLPETSEVAAQQVARRLAERVAADGEQPPLTVSIGVAEHPRDGTSVESLIGAADRLLYGAKAQSSRRVLAVPEGPP